MKVKVTVGNEVGYPPIGSVGTAKRKGLLGLGYEFVPDNQEHYPPDCPPEEFAHYDLNFWEIRKIK